MQFAVQRLFGRFASVNAALGKLPGVTAAHAARPEHLTMVVRQHYSYIRTEAVGVNHFALPPIIGTGHCSIFY